MLPGRRLPIGDVFNIRDIFGQVFRPALCGCSRIPVEQIVDSGFENLSDASGDNQDHEADKGDFLENCDPKLIEHRCLW
jgi:hypothetical protein